MLLYDFFGDSGVDASRWRVVLNEVEGQGYAPDFYRDETRYAGICSEVSTSLFDKGMYPTLLLSVETPLRGDHPSKKELVDL